MEARRTTGRRWRPPTPQPPCPSARRSGPARHDRLRCRCTGVADVLVRRKYREPPSSWGVWSSGDPTPLSRRCPPAQCPPVRGRARAGAAAAAPPCTGAAAGPKHRSAARTAQRASAHRAPHPAPRKGRGFQVGQPPTGTAPETIPSPRRPEPVPYSVDRCAAPRRAAFGSCGAVRPPATGRRSGSAAQGAPADHPETRLFEDAAGEEGSFAAARGAG
jgi:hypothetical protein